MLDGDLNWDTCRQRSLLGHLRADDGVAGGDHVAGEGEEARGEAGLGQHPELDLVEAHGLVIPPPVPAGDVQQEGLGNSMQTCKRCLMGP